MNKIIIYTVFFSIFVLHTTHAQTVSTELKHEIHELNNLWLNANNAAGLGFTNFESYGLSYIGYQQSNGNLRRAQQGDSNGGLIFGSQRYNKIGNDWYTWGQFSFQTDREKNKSWSNVFNPYNDSPYIFGDSVKATYDKQLFDLKAKIAKRANDTWGYGLSLNYNAGDMSRIRDPRTRTFIVNYSAQPSVVIALGQSQQVGLNIGLGFEKEKMPSVVTIQTDPKIDYYFFLGNENAYAVLDGYKAFSRQYTTLKYNAGLQHVYKSNNTQLFNSLSYLNRKQEVLGSERESPGNFKSQQFEFESRLSQISGKYMFGYQLVGNYKAGVANEYLQERVEIRNPETGVTSREWKTLFVYNNRYTTNSYNIQLQSDIKRLTADKTEYLWKLGIDMSAFGFDNKYYMPQSSFVSDIAKIGVFGAVRLFEKSKHAIVFNAKASQSLSLNNSVVLNNIASTSPSIYDTNFEKATKRIASEITLFDANMLSENIFSYEMALQYSFPIQLKASTITGALKAFYNDANAMSLGNRQFAGFSFSIITQ